MHLRSSSSGGGNSDERTESTSDGKSLSNWCVHKVEELRVRVASEEVGNFL